MKTFIALELKNEVKAKLGDIQNILNQYSIKGKYVNIDNFHITLKYLGETSQSQSENIIKELNKISYDFKTINLEFNKLSSFKKEEILRVVWVGLNGETHKLIHLNKIIENEIDKLGFNKEKRRYKPHITIGRNIEFSKSIEDLNKLLFLKLKYMFAAQYICLMKSELIEGKRVYTPIKKFRLQN